MNGYKILAVFLVFVLIAEGIVIYNNYKEDKDVYKFGDFEIEKSVMNDLSNTQGEVFELCSISNNECIGLTKIPT